MFPRSAWDDASELRQHLDKATERLRQDEEALIERPPSSVGRSAATLALGVALAVGAQVGCTSTPAPEPGASQAKAPPPVTRPSTSASPRPSPSQPPAMPVPPYGVPPPPPTTVPRPPGPRAERPMAAPVAENTAQPSGSVRPVQDAPEDPAARDRA